MIVAENIKMRGVTMATEVGPAANGWEECRYLTCSILPVRMACNLACKFCFSKSSVSALRQDRNEWSAAQLERYFEYSATMGATRLVVTGGGEPLLRPDAVRLGLRIGSRYFKEMVLFTNGSLLDRELARVLAEEGLSYVCYSRHHYDDGRNRELMGGPAIGLDTFFKNVAGLLKVRATCVLCRGEVEGRKEAVEYVRRLQLYGVREFTFKHTYVAYKRSLFGGSVQDHWARDRQVQEDPFAGEGDVVARLPWGPEIKRIGESQICYYYEPTPDWELEHRLGRSLNLLVDGKIYGSLEDQRSLLSLPV
jgi:pyruvate-formate lyase-activating enzyme